MSETALIKDEIIRIVGDKKIAPNALIKKASAIFPFKRDEAKFALRELIEAGRLSYAYKHGRSFIEKSFDRPVRISRHVVLKPPYASFKPKPGDVVVELNSGDSFGTGEHPTTRLAVRGVEYVMGKASVANASMLDIGTGSGILAITAAGFGVKKAVGVDIDPCARFEAKRNVALNRHERKIAINNRSINKIDDLFFLITANLRFPTIKKLSGKLFQLLKTDGYILFSGLYDEESDEIKNMWGAKKTRLRWEESEMGWTGVIFQRREEK